jgi:hypothetical protein
MQAGLRHFVLRRKTFIVHTHDFLNPHPFLFLVLESRQLLAHLEVLPPVLALGQLFAALCHFFPPARVCFGSTSVALLRRPTVFGAQRMDR